MKNENLFRPISTIHKMWLIHQTTLSGLRKILKDGYIHPAAKTGNERSDMKLKEVYMSVLFDDMTVDGQGGSVDILLFFPLDIMKRHRPTHWTPTWSYGEVEDDTIGYVPSKSPSENARRWHSVFRDIHSRKSDFLYSKGKNEVVFSESIPIEEVAFIYVRKDVSIPFDVPKRIDTKQKLNREISG